MRLLAGFRQGRQTGKRAGDMKKKGKIRLAILTVLVAATNCLCGCSIIGYGAGLAIDNSIDDKKRFTNWECGKISRGTETTVYLSDGDTLWGEFASMEKKPSEEYNDEYAEFHRANKKEIYLPEIGDTLRIRNRDGDQGMHEFLGFDYIYIGSGRSYKKQTRALYTDVSAFTLDRKKEKNYPIKYLDKLTTKDGNAVTGEELEGLFSEATVPIRSRMVLQTNAGIEQLNFEDIRSVDVPRKKYAKWVGLSLGLIADGLIVAVIIAFQSWNGPCWG